MPATFVNGPRPVMSYESLSVSSSASTVAPSLTKIRSVTASNPGAGTADVIAETAVEAFVSVEGAQVRYRIDGTAPTGTEGHILNSGDTLTVQGYTNIKNLQLTITGTTTAVIKATYFK